MTDRDEYTRHDVPEWLRRFIARARELDIVDDADVIALTLSHGTNWAGHVDDVLSYAYANRHVDRGASHKAIVAFRDDLMSYLHNGMAAALATEEA